MSHDKMREDFEVFRDKRNAQLEAEGHKPGSKWHVTQEHYATWQASRAAVVVELPRKTPFYSAKNNTIDACARAIEAVGIKATGEQP